VTAVPVAIGRYDPSNSSFRDNHTGGNASFIRGMPRFEPPFTRTQAMRFD